MSPGRRPLPSGHRSGFGASWRHDRHRDEVIHVGRMPRTDTFRIGVEVLPRPRDLDPGRRPLPSA